MTKKSDQEFIDKLKKELKEESQLKTDSSSISAQVEDYSVSASTSPSAIPGTSVTG